MTKDKFSKSELFKTYHVYYNKFTTLVKFSALWYS